ncbi:MAG: prolipoprotein diacylglyceryl transferase [Candidatus Fimadaptatus sp.]
MWTPNRVAFTLGPLTVNWYGVLIAAAVLIGYLLAAREQKRLGLPEGTMLDIFFYIVPLAIICARIYYVAFSWDMFRDRPLDILMIHKGGIAIYGAVLGGILGAYIFSRRRHVPMGKLMDMLTPSLVLGQAIGRWGNFFNQEAYGALITDARWQFFPAGVYIEALGEWHMATFFYESAWCLAVFAVLMATRRRYTHSGDVLCWYAVLYGAERAIVEGMRTDSLYLGGVRMSQLLSMLMILTVLVLFFARRRHRTAGDVAALAAGCALGAGLIAFTCFMGSYALVPELICVAGMAALCLYLYRRPRAA